METATHREWRLVRFTAPAVLLLGAAGGTPPVAADLSLPHYQIQEIASALRGSHQVVVRDLNRDGRLDANEVATGMPEPSSPLPEDSPPSGSHRGVPRMKLRSQC